MLPRIGSRRREEGGGQAGEEEKEFEFEPFYKGITMLKFGKRGSPHEKVFRLSGNQRFISWSSGWFTFKFGRKCSVDLEKVVRIQQGQKTFQFERSAANFGLAKDKSFSIIYTNEAGVETSLDLVAPTPEIFKYWMKGVNTLLEKIDSFRNNTAPDEQYIKAMWEKADKDSSGTLSYQEIVQVLQEMNINMSTKNIRAVFKKVDADNSNDLSYDEFIELIEKLRERPELRHLWKTIFYGNVPPSTQLDTFKFTDQEPKNMKKTITMKQFIEFWAKVMGETMTPEEVHTMLTANDPSVPVMPEFQDPDTAAEEKEEFLHKLVISYQQWMKAISSFKSNELMDPYKADLHQDMTLPLSDYFMASSHNTYLEGDQLTSASSVNRYVDDLRSGCRCVELDCWDGDKGEPIIFHGFTLTSKIIFKDVIQAIREHGFVASPYPIVLSLENHCSLDQQQRMVYHLKMILKEMLYLPSENALKRLPSPEELKYKVLIKGKRINENTEEEEAEDPDEDAEPTTPSGKTRSHKAHKAKSVAKDIHPELSDITFLGTAKVHEFNEETYKGTPCNLMCSYSENKTLKYLADAEKTKGWINHNTNHMSRIYPKGSRVDSSNYNPAPAWAAGNQMVALNYQTKDINMMANLGKFRENASCGYVLKPEFMRGLALASPSDPIKLTVHIISAQQLPKPGGQSEGEIIDPYVIAAIVGVPEDCAEHRTAYITDNGFNPVWNVTTTFTIKNPDVAVLVLQVWDEDVASSDFIAYAAYPVLTLRDGLRCCALSDVNGKRNHDFQYASLCVRIHSEVVSA